MRFRVQVRRVIFCCHLKSGCEESGFVGCSHIVNIHGKAIPAGYSPWDDTFALPARAGTMLIVGGFKSYIHHNSTSQSAQLPDMSDAASGVRYGHRQGSVVFASY